MPQLTLDHRFRFRFRDAGIAWGSLGDGPPIVLIHGTPFSSQVWRRIAPQLARWRTVYVFDLLGYGRSEMREDLDVSLDVQDKLLAALFDHWRLERPDVLAHDFGGATALRGWILGGLRYRTLTLLDPVALAPWGSPFVRHVREHERAFASMPGYAHRALLTAYLQGAAAQPFSEEALKTYLAPWLGEVGQRGFYAQIAQMDERFTREIEDRLEEIDAPTTILWGERDDWLPVEQGRRLAERVPGARFRPVPEAGHLLQEDAPEVVLAETADLLLAADAAPAARR